MGKILKKSPCALFLKLHEMRKSDFLNLTEKIKMLARLKIGFHINFVVLKKTFRNMSILLASAKLAYYFQQFFLTAIIRLPRGRLRHCQGGSLTNPMLITFNLAFGSRVRLCLDLSAPFSIIWASYPLFFDLAFFQKFPYDLFVQSSLINKHLRILNNFDVFFSPKFRFKVNESSYFLK